MTKVYIIHGYRACPEKHWFLWLQAALMKNNIQVEILTLPTPHTPCVEEWLQTLQETLTPLNKETYIVAHSLGMITTLRYLQNQCEVGGIVLVSAFADPLPTLPQLDSFTDVTLSYELLTKLPITIISAQDDVIVPHEHSKKLAKRLEATWIATPDGNHFMQDDGYTTFPLVYDVLQKMMKQ